MQQKWKLPVALVAGAIPLLAWWLVLIPSRAYAFGTGGVNEHTLWTSALYGRFCGLLVLSVPFWRFVANALMEPDEKSWLPKLADVPTKKWVLGAAFGAFATAALARTWILHGAPLTDDEAAYQFGARLLLHGRLWTPSPEPRLFFDNYFLINDGQLYPQYPLGWPALLAIGMPVGLGGFVNPILSALTVPAIYGLAHHFRGPSAARLATILFALSPMLAIGAATQMSHTSALCAITWALWIAITRIDQPSVRWDAKLAFVLCAAVFIRPTVGASFTFVLAPWWLYNRVLSKDARQRGLRLAVFVLIAGVIGAAFLAVNASQTGSPFKLAYQRSLEYVAENKFRFSPWSSKMGFMKSTDVIGRISIALFAALRLNSDLFYFPLGLVPLAFVQWSRKFAVLVAAICVSFFVHSFANDVGVDTFAPVHFFELGGPLIVLVAIGLHDIAERTSTRLVLSIGLATAFIAFCTIIPMHIVELRRLAYSAGMPSATVDDSGISNAVVFNVGPELQCAPHAHQFVHAHPTNSPDLDDDVIWVNHLNVQMDRELMKTKFPDRKGFLLMTRKNCTMAVVPLDSDDSKFAMPSPYLNR